MRRFLMLFALAFTFCAPVTVHVGAPKEARPDMAIPDPAYEKGNPAAGRVAFATNGCAECHRVADDPSLVPGMHGATGPLLRDLDRIAPNQLAQRITSGNAGSGAKFGDVSMTGCARNLSQTEVIDIVSYLRAPGRG